MNTIFVEIGVFCVALMLTIYGQIFEERKASRDCLLFSHLLLATAGILVVDTVGWIIDGAPVCGQIWFTTVVDGLDLLLTTTVCWCWVQYALYIAGGDAEIQRPRYRDPATWLLLLQIVLVGTSQFLGFYYYIDAAGVYHRGAGYLLHVLISMAMLAYSSGMCLHAYRREKDAEQRRELFFAATIILIPILGNVFQFFVYGYPTVWLCMCFMICTVHIHIQNKRIDAEREKQNRCLAKALEQAQVANRAKSDFLSRMSHDMRTPMNAILGITSLLRDRTDPAEIRADVEQIEKSGKYLLNLINDTLDMNKIESGKLELHAAPINSEDLFGNVIATAHVLAAQKGVQLREEFPPIRHGEWVPVVADASRVEQIFMNLITNAVKFTPAGGLVTIHMDTVSIDADTVSDRYIISDTGVGMSEEFQKHLFEPFAQEGRVNTDRESGTGLGLAIVKQIMDRMGGTIHIESKPNEGTRITLALSYPRYHGKLDAAQHASSNISVLRGKRVLLCEDHPVNAQIAARLLEKQGMQTDLAENGALGVEKLRASAAGYYDAVLMDIRMPVMDGLTAARKMRALDRPDAKTIPIIAMTANAYDADIQSSFDAGMNAHLAKPVDPEKMYETIAGLLQTPSAPK